LFAAVSPAEQQASAKGATMTSAAAGVLTVNEPRTAPIQAHIDRAIEDLLASLPNPGQLSPDERRGIIARYTAVLEGNFIYWMTGAYISVGSDEARAKIMDNLREEVRDCHPGMMRRFALAAQAIPTDTDAQAVYRDLMNVRLFIGRLSSVPTVVTMAFFEGFIQRFMPYLAELAQRQGSAEMEYTDVHGVCDITHTQELFRALEAEMALEPAVADRDMFEGVELLRALIQNIVVNN
jgi:DNA-binding Lrp family transcriptional regulator